MLHTLKHSFKIICLTETWFQEDILATNFKLEGYNVLHQTRKLNKNGGGVCIYVHNSLNQC